MLEQPGLIAIHEARTIQKLAMAVFDIVKKAMSCQLVFAALRPLEFELPCLASEAKYKPVLDRYIESDHKFDVWLKRSPIHPRVTVVRHSDYTPHPKLIRTRFYKETLRALDSDHGVSIVAWRSSTWLATFTVFRNAKQGDATEQDMAFLRALQPHVASAVKRLAGRQEKILSQRSFSYVCEHSTQGIIILGWELNQIYSNKSARGLVRKWSGRGSGRGTTLAMPPDIHEALVKMKPAIQATKPNRPFTPRHLDLRILVKKDGEKLMAKITFIPAKALTISKGSFLIMISELGSAEPSLSTRFEKLTGRQTECVKHVAAGLSNREIAKRMGISLNTARNQLSFAMRKLGLKTRYEVASAVIKSHPAG